MVGVLIVIALTATDATLALKRLFPGSFAVNYMGTALSVIGVLLLGRYLARRSR